MTKSAIQNPNKDIRAAMVQHVTLQASTVAGVGTCIMTGGPTVTAYMGQLARSCFTHD